MNTAPKLQSRLISAADQWDEYAAASLTSSNATLWRNSAQLLRDAADALAPTSGEGVDSDRREFLGKLVRMEWVAWAREQPNAKPSWLLPWEQLTEPEREVDRRIGERIYQVAVIDATTPQSAPVDGAFERAMKASWEMVVSHPTWAAGSYYAGQNNGMIAALETVRDNYQREIARQPPTTPPPASQERSGEIPETMFHGAGAYAQCHYCKRYSRDPATLSDRAPACECGKEHGWSGSFSPPTPESTFTASPPSSAAEDDGSFSIRNMYVAEQAGSAAELPDGCACRRQHCIWPDCDWAEQAQAGEVCPFCGREGKHLGNEACQGLNNPTTFTLTNELPDLPEHAGTMEWTRQSGRIDIPELGYTADQMRDYANACRLAGGVTVDDEMARIGELIRTQNNRVTDQPIFIVQQRRGKGWDFVTACFTEQGCKDYIAIDGHNLKEPRIYASGSFRNAEWRAVRNYLISLEPRVALVAALGAK